MSDIRELMLIVARSATPERARAIRANLTALSGVEPSPGRRDHRQCRYLRPAKTGPRLDAPRQLMLMVARQIEATEPERAATIRANVRACSHDRDRLDHPPRVALEFNLAAQAWHRQQLALVKYARVAPRGYLTRQVRRRSVSLMGWQLERWHTLRPGQVVLGPDNTAYEIRQRYNLTFVLLSWHGISRTVDASPTSLPVMTWVLQAPAPVDPVTSLLMAFPGSHVTATVEHGGVQWRCPTALAQVPLAVHLTDFHGERGDGLDHATLARVHAAAHAAGVAVTHGHY